MATNELAYTPTEAQLQIISKNKLVNYVRSLFADKNIVTKPAYEDLKFYFKDRIDLNGPVYTFGDSIASNEANNALRTYFPWNSLRAFSREEYEEAARVLGYTVYKGANSPYANFYLKSDEFGIINFDEQPVTNQSKAVSLWDKIQFQLRANRKPVLESSYSALKFENKEVYIPELNLEFRPGTEVPISVIGLNSSYSTGNSRAVMIKQIVEHLQYSLPPIQLPEPLVYVPLTTLVPSKDHYNAVKNNAYWTKPNGVYFLDSEVPDNLK